VTQQGYFERLKGTLLVHTPGEREGDALDYVRDLRKVRAPSDLPRRLLMGYRDDSSFESTPGGFSIVYRLDDEPVLRLKVEGERLHFSQQWHGVEGAGGVTSADDLASLVRIPLIADSWQSHIEAKLGESGNFIYLRDEASVAGLPDGHLAELAFPINAQSLPELVRFYEDFWDATPESLGPRGLSVFVDLPVWHVWSANADASVIDQWAHRFWASYNKRLGCVQRMPGDVERGADGSQTVTISREGFLHVAMLPLRDLLPFAAALVKGHWVAPYRFEDDPKTDREDWDLALAPYRAVVSLGGGATLGVQFTSEDARIEVLFPSVAELMTEAIEGGVFDEVTFARTLEVAERMHEAFREYERRAREVMRRYGAPE
jgi:hypothetical protein